MESAYSPDGAGDHLPVQHTGFTVVLRRTGSVLHGDRDLFPELGSGRVRTVRNRRALHLPVDLVGRPPNVATSIESPESARSDLVEVLDRHRPAVGSGPGDHGIHKHLVESDAVHDGCRHRNHHPPHSGNKRDGPWLWRALPTIRHRERGSDSDILRRTRVHDVDDRTTSCGDRC